MRTQAEAIELRKIAEERDQLRIQLEAWQSVFGTSQLSHAQARLEQAEKMAKKGEEMSKSRKVIMSVKDGVINPVYIPKGLQVVVRDYDVMLLAADNPDEFQEIVFEE